MPPSFSSRQESDLIAMVEERRFLWDITDSKYYRHDLKDSSFEEIAMKLGPDFTAAAVKGRFSNLRSQFQRENRKVKASEKSGAGQDDVYVPRWGHYWELLFLLSGCPKRDSRSNLASASCLCFVVLFLSSAILRIIFLLAESRAQSQAESEGTEIIDSVQQRSDAMQQPVDNTESETMCTGAVVNEEPADNSSTSRVCLATPPTVRSREPMKRKQEESCSSEKKLLLEAAVQALNKSANSARQRDECEDFAATIANALRQLPEGHQRQMAYLAGYDAIVKYSMTLYNTQVEVIEKVE